MKVCGFTIIRNAIKFDYPIVEAITSILPLCDEFIVLVGNSEDETKQLIQSINSSKIKIFESTWDDSLREGGKVLAVETNKAFDLISNDFDWAFYIQADEIIHEKYHASIETAMELYCKNKNVEGLLFNYLHFYGSYDFVGDTRHWYRNEIRIIKNDKQIRSYKDAQGFRKNGQKLHVKQIGAFVYHYGWVKPPFAQQQKQLTFNKMWHNDEWVNKNVPFVAEFDYSQIDSLSKYNGTHPLVMQARINQMNWKFNFDPTQKKFSIKLKFLSLIERMFGWRIGEYKNYIKI